MLSGFTTTDIMQNKFLVCLVMCREVYYDVYYDKMKKDNHTVLRHTMVTWLYTEQRCHCDNHGEVFTLTYVYKRVKNSDVYRNGQKSEKQGKMQQDSI